MSTAPAEPANVREMFARAQTDLAAKWAPATELRWVFWHARGVGRLEVARYALKRLELQDAECHTRALSVTNVGSFAEAYQAARPTTALNGAAEIIVEAAAYVQAAASVLEMLRGRRP